MQQLRDDQRVGSRPQDDIPATACVSEPRCQRLTSVLGFMQERHQQESIVRYILPSSKPFMQIILVVSSKMTPCGRQRQQGIRHLDFLHRTIPLRIHQEGMILLNQDPLLRLVRRRLARDDDVLPVFRGLFTRVWIRCSRGIVRVFPVERDASLGGPV